MAGIQKKGESRLNPHSGIVQQPRCAGGKFCGIGSSIEKEIDRKTGSKMAGKWLENGWKMVGKWQQNQQRKNICPDLTPPPTRRRFSSHTALFMRACHVHSRRPS